MAIILQIKVFVTEINTINGIGRLRRITSKALTFERFGNPLSVVKMVERNLPPLGDDDVLVRMLAAPVNPADINIIQGKYPLKPKLPTVPGSEGVGIVEEVGKNVKRITTGHKVIIAKPGHGTWRNRAVFNKDLLRTVPQHLGLVECATLTVNPCTAYRMLTDFKPLRKNNDLVVIQNGANSAVGQNVIQLCNAWGIKNVNIVRDRTNIDELKEYLTCLGATHVLTEDELQDTYLFKQKVINRPVLALNCVGGQSSSRVIKHMARYGTMVTYGGMSRKPVTIPTGAFIFKKLSFVGFWMTEWALEAKEHEKDKMLTELINLLCENRLRAPMHKIVHFERYKEAIGNTLTGEGFAGCKYIMDLSCTF